MGKLSDKFSRERAFGNCPDVLDTARLLLLGGGALANNVAMNLALLGVRSVAIVDYDTIEEHNITRSPGFGRALAGDATGKSKARVLAESFLKVSEHGDPIASYAITRVEALGRGIFGGASAVISCVDSYGARVDVARATRLMGVPFFDAGFYEADCYVTAYPNAREDEPCSRCLYDPPRPRGASCTLYARRAVEEGFVPSAQSVAATAGGLLAEAVVRGLHGEFPLAGRQLLLNARTGRSRLVNLAADPACRAKHHIAREVVDLAVGPEDTASELLDALGAIVAEPVVELPHGVLLDAPCARCGASVPIDLPDWAPRVVPACLGGCPGNGKTAPGEFLYAADFHARSGARTLGASLARLGVAPGDVLVARSSTARRPDGAPVFVRLAGDPQSLLTAATLDAPQVRHAPQEG